MADDAKVRNSAPEDLKDLPESPFYELTEKDKEVIKAVIQAGAPVAFGDIVNWMIVAKILGCDLQAANHALAKSMMSVMEIIKSAKSGLIVAPASTQIKKSNLM